MRFSKILALLLGAALGCNEPERAAGTLRTMADLLAAAGKGDPDGTANVTLRGQPIVWLSSPFNPGTLKQEPDREQRFQSAAAFENALAQIPAAGASELAKEIQRLFGEELKAEQAKFASIEPPPDEPPDEGNVEAI